MKKTIICLHGMRTGRYHDFSLFARIIKKEHPEYDVQLLEYYDPLNKKTLKTNAFYTTVKSEVEKLSDGYDDVTLVGYSMGGPLALIP